MKGKRRDREPPTRLLYSPAEAAAMLGVSVKTLKAEVRAGRLRVVLIRSRTKFSVDDLRAYIDRQRVAPPSLATASRGRARNVPAKSGDVIGFVEALRRTGPPAAWSEAVTVEADTGRPSRRGT